MQIPVLKAIIAKQEHSSALLSAKKKIRISYRANFLDPRAAMPPSAIAPDESMSANAVESAPVAGIPGVPMSTVAPVSVVVCALVNDGTDNIAANAKTVRIDPNFFIYFKLNNNIIY
jgi:hypothetical protein